MPTGRHHTTHRKVVSIVTTLVEHAKYELDLCGQMAEDPAFAQSIIAAVAAFASYGHSGGSAGVAIDMLHHLLQRRHISPLTSSPDEWEDRSEQSGYPMWQNRRDSAAFSNDGGITHWFVDADADDRRGCPSAEKPGRTMSMEEVVATRERAK